MALNAYLKVRGQKQGEIRGSISKIGHEGQILVIAVEHDLELPWEPASGLPTQQRIHKPITITKEVDQSTPLFYKAFIDNEALTEWDLQFWTLSGRGKEKQHYTIKLTHALIVRIQFHMPNTRNSNLARFSEYEDISFTYQKIQWIWTEDNIIAEADWATSAV